MRCSSKVTAAARRQALRRREYIRRGLGIVEERGVERLIRFARNASRIQGMTALRIVRAMLSRWRASMSGCAAARC